MVVWRYPVLLAVLVAAYWVMISFGNPIQSNKVQGSGDRIVIAAPLQVVLAFGDRYLAANVETIRLASTGMNINRNTGVVDGQYLLRGHLAVSELNSCHEDNYYLANALLAWGGAEASANGILRAAMECRHWDFFPAFLYGFNQYFFNQNVLEAQRALEVAAERSSENAAAMKRFSVMIGAEEFDDEAMALAYLEEQQAKADDAALAESLQNRVDRLKGLIQLREAQSVYEADFDQPLPSPQALLNAGLIEAFPNDPLGIGYEFVNGQFKLRQLRIQGVERPQ